jgi:hypothetical protein
MTEQEWLTSNDPAAMLNVVYHDARPEIKRASPRQLRLFVEACRLRSELCDHIGDLANPAGLYVAVEYWASKDGKQVSQSLRCALLRDIFGNPFRPVELPRTKLKCPNRCDREGFIRISDQWFSCPVCAGSKIVDGPCPWLTPNVLAVAQTIYEERRFDEMPILADALEEAGCTNEDILNHCRGLRRCVGCLKALAANCICRGTGWLPMEKYPAIGPHVRGCWALDTILGKS